MIYSIFLSIFILFLIYIYLKRNMYTVCYFGCQYESRLVLCGPTPLSLWVLCLFLQYGIRLFISDFRHYQIWKHRASSCIIGYALLIWRQLALGFFIYLFNHIVFKNNICSYSVLWLCDRLCALFLFFCSTAIKGVVQRK